MMENKILTRISSLVLILCATLVFLGCSKSDGGPDSAEQTYFRFKLNGTQKDYKYQINANDPPSEDIVHFVTVGAHEGPEVTSTGLMFQLVSEKGAKVGVYHVDSNDGDELHSTYYIQNVVNGKIVSTTTYGTSDSPFTLEITKLSKWGVQGKFNGTLKRSGSSEIITITDGEFSAPYN